MSAADKSDNPKLAVLIDADNASSSLVTELLEEVAKFGTATIRRDSTTREAERCCTVSCWRSR